MLTISPEPCIQAFTPFFPSPLLFFFSPLPGRQVTLVVVVDRVPKLHRQERSALIIQY